QDTVIALQALAAYGEATYNSATQNRVKITSPKPFEKVFIVNNDNRLLLQQTPLPEVPGNYSLTVNSSGCIFMQVTVVFSLHYEQGASPGMVHTDRGLCCFSYTGKRSSSNMLIIDVKMLSGFVPVKSSLDKVNY
ncbi:OVOS protein, partial [Neodrepanis coruscans]|nr:OVOS protein [Neodrepanis coruscans]